MVRKSDKTTDLSIVLILSLALTSLIFWNKKEINYYSITFLKILCVAFLK